MTTLEEQMKEMLNDKTSPLKTIQIKDGEGPRSTFTKLNKLNVRDEDKER